MLLNDIKSDLLAARKLKAVSSSVLSTLVGEITTKEKTFNPARDITDGEVLAIVQKFIKNNNEALSVLDRLPVERRDQVEAGLIAENSALEKYVPKQMDEQALADFFTMSKQQGSTSFGALMGALKEACAGSYDGKLASMVAKRFV